MVTGTGSSGLKKAKLPMAFDRTISLVLNGLCERRPAEEVCREAGISLTLYRQWQQQITQAASVRAAHANSDSTLEKRIAQLEAENADLQQQIRIYRGLCIED